MEHVADKEAAEKREEKAIGITGQSLYPNPPGHRTDPERICTNHWGAVRGQLGTWAMLSQLWRDEKNRSVL